MPGGEKADEESGRRPPRKRQKLVPKGTVPRAIAGLDLRARRSIYDFIAGSILSSRAVFLLSAPALLVVAYLFYVSGPWRVLLALIVIGALVSYGSIYYYGDRLVLSRICARPATSEEFSHYVNCVEGLAIAAGLPCPRSYVIDAAAPNALSTGRDPKHAVICVTTGLLNLMTRAELEGVIAHEFAHIKNYDTRVCMLLSALLAITDQNRGRQKDDVWDLMIQHWRLVLAGLIGLAGACVAGALMLGGTVAGGLVLVAIGIFIILMLWTMTGLVPDLLDLLRAAAMRNRDFLADASAALLTRHPEALATALSKMSRRVRSQILADGVIANLWAANPPPATVRRFRRFLKMQPPLEERIRRLRAM